MSVLNGLWPRLRRDLELMRMLTPRELRVRYRQSLLHVAWAVVSPIVILATYGFILTRSFDVTASCGPYLSSAWAGLMVWTFFATAVGGASTSLLASSDLLTKVYFPREALPLSVTGSAAVDLLVGMSTVVLLFVIQGVPFHLSQLAAVVPLAVIMLWTAAISVMVGVLAAFARDVVHGVQLALRVGIFVTPVMFEADFLPAGLAWSAKVNPLAATITELRMTLLCGTWPDLSLMGIHFAVAAAAFVGAILYTRSIESRITDVI